MFANVFANICVKQNSSFCSFDFTILHSIFMFLFLYFSILFSIMQCSVLVVEKISCFRKQIALVRLIC